MKTTKFIAAAVFAIASTGAFAETGVKFSQIDNVTNIYGRSAVATTNVAGDVQTAGALVSNSGRQIAATEGTTIFSGKATQAGRS